ncbi:RNase P subunit p30-domain-containing protein [Filobasidium floriforme]|uniref:RNase P subunit p30-domain-containing protein n=1 Tax=Filobasidium floriforme TaxID=5210 RepID=UPI001E8ED6BC|nr:RNase P subunit p30-domain-containing protein [Filobasidium floriforme]KAH8079729.1 RNase P subunit p30-domain-containing protein [Filobasidium floriforme]
MYNAADLFLPFPHPPVAAGSSSSTPGSGSGSGAKKGKQNKANGNVNANGNTESPYGSRAGSPAGTLGPTEVFDTASSTSTSGIVKATRWAEEKYWRALPGGREEKEAKRGLVAQAGYFGYSIVAYTITPARPGAIPINPFYPSSSSSSQTQSQGQPQIGEPIGSVPFPEYDPRWASGSGKKAGAGGMGVRQMGRLHLVVDDSNVHGLTASQTPLLQTWDLISLQPLTPESFSKVCTELTRPGANQVGIITVSTSGARLPFKGMKRSLVRAALRNGAVFEICYASALGSQNDEKARQNFLTNAREAVRVIMAVSGGGGRDGVDKRGKGGGGIIFSSGDGSGVRGPADLINLATLLGMPANQAKEAVMDTPLKVILRAQARRAYKGVMSVPRMVMPETKVKTAAESTTTMEIDQDEAENQAESTSKRKAAEVEVSKQVKKVKAA